MLGRHITAGAAAATLALGCGGAGDEVQSTASTTTTTGWTSSTSTTTNGTTSSTTTVAGVCDPPATPGSLYELSAPAFDVAEQVSMCHYRGDVMLVVNTAAL